MSRLYADYPCELRLYGLRLNDWSFFCVFAIDRYDGFRFEFIMKVIPVRPTGMSGKRER